MRRRLHLLTCSPRRPEHEGDTMRSYGIRASEVSPWPPWSCDQTSVIRIASAAVPWVPAMEDALCSWRFRLHTESPYETRSVFFLLEWSLSYVLSLMLWLILRHMSYIPYVLLSYTRSCDVDLWFCCIGWLDLHA